MTSFDLISDTHFDFYEHCSYTRSRNKYTFYRGNFHDEKTLNFRDKKDFVELWKSWKPKSKHLLIAGDIGHRNAENVLCLRYLREEFYDTVSLVLGNHDLYLLDFAFTNSLDRVKDFKERVSGLDNVFLLDGSIVEIEGIRVGGTMGWYDGSFIKSQSHKEKNYLWYNTMRDATAIRSKDLPRPLLFDSIFKVEYPKIEYISDKSDIVLTHVNPSNQPKHQDEDFVYYDTTGFYSFDGSRLLESTTAKYWLYGHTHKARKFKINNTTVLCNPRGYPFQNEKFLIKQINFPNS